LKNAGYPIVLTKPLLKHSTSHQCGTVRFGVDPTVSALDPFCRSHDHSNLYIVDASFMPSSAAVNPALTIAAQALRAADHMLMRDWGVTPARPAKTASSVRRHEPKSVRPET
jgi:choline dehydrogenase-like flavoprotein